VFRKSLNEVVPFVTVSLGAHVNDEIHLGNGQFPVSWDGLLESLIMEETRELKIPERYLSDWVACGPLAFYTPRVRR